MILNFKQFINEKFIPQPTDSVTSASDKNFFNEEEDLIQKFNSNKVDLENIYKTYTNADDLMNKLFNKGFIVQKTADSNKKKFKNRYLSKWASICDKKRRIQDIEAIMSGNQEDISNYNKSLTDNKGNETIISYTQDKIDNTNERLQKNKYKIIQLQKDILDLDSELKKDFEILKKKHQELKNKITKSEIEKKSTPANLDEGSSKETA